MIDESAEQERAPPHKDAEKARSMEIFLRVTASMYCMPPSTSVEPLLPPSSEIGKDQTNITRRRGSRRIFCTYCSLQQQLFTVRAAAAQPMKGRAGRIALLGRFFGGDFFHDSEWVDGLVRGTCPPGTRHLPACALPWFLLHARDGWGGVG